MTYCFNRRPDKTMCIYIIIYYPFFFCGIEDRILPGVLLHLNIESERYKFYSISIEALKFSPNIAAHNLYIYNVEDRRLDGTEMCIDRGGVKFV